MRWGGLILFIALVWVAHAQELPSREAWGVLPNGSVLIQAEDCNGTWRKQTNIAGYTGTSFRCGNVFGKVGSSKLNYEAAIEEASRYQVWARAYCGEDTDRSFQIVVGETALPRTHTERKSQRYFWQHAGEIELPAGKTRLEIRDTGDGYESVDAVLLTPDGAFDPETKESAFHRATRVLPDGEGDKILRASLDALLPPRTLTKWTDRWDWNMRRQEVREIILRDIGLWPLPKRVPLDIRRVGTIQRDGYRVEHIFYQVFPNIYASGYLYVPDRKGKEKLPAILTPHGHWDGPTDPVVQSLNIGLAKLGFVSFCPASTHVIDLETGLCPIGQMTWDNIRGLDLLQSLPEVDGARIGCTGGSGGGQQTMYVSAVDDRIQVPIVAVMTSYFWRILDPKQSIHCRCNHAPGIARDTDETEMIATVAPKPTLFLCVTTDWTANFPREEFPEIRHIFELMGASDRTCFVQFDKPHDYDREMREHTYAWFTRWLKGREVGTTLAEPPFKAEDAKTLRDLGKLPEGLKDIEAAKPYYREKFVAGAPALKSAGDLQAFRKKFRPELDRVLGRDTVFAPNRRTVGMEKIFGVVADRVLLSPESHRQVPALLIWPDDVPRRVPAVVIADPRGKERFLLGYWPLLEALRAKKIAVLVLDAGFSGEVAAEWDWNQVITRRPVAGIAADDIRAANAFLRQRSGIDGDKIVCVGLGDHGISALLAASLDENVRAVAALRLGGTYRNGRERPFLPNLLRVGDLPEIAALVAPRPMFLAGAYERDYEFARHAYDLTGHKDNLRFDLDADNDGARFLAWLGEFLSRP